MVDLLPKKKQCIFSGKNSVRHQMASEECWKMDLYGSLKFSTIILRKTPSKVSCSCFQGVPLTLDI